MDESRAADPVFYKFIKAMPAAPRLITLMTDFGAKDHFVGVMKGVIAGIAPGARVVDLTHEIEAFQVKQARYLLSQSWPYFPPRTIHVVVVDPGVGSARRPLLVEANSQLFIGPDNGVLSEVVALPKAKVRELTNRKLWLDEVSATFHGRDVFAPVAAHMATGVTPARAGKLIKDARRDAGMAPVRTGKRFWVGEVVHVDRFGNLITNLTPPDMPELGPRIVALKAGYEVIAGLSTHYAAAAPGAVVALVGSGGTIEIAVHQGRADRKLGLSVGSPVELELV
jgi:S-adenosyl-L-methionine hydrolase (adenosine-forming)